MPSPPSNALFPSTVHDRWMDESYVEGLVSVVIPTYNRAPLLREALASIREQTYRPVEVLVADDGSTDETPHVVEKFDAGADSGLTVRHLHQPHRGIISTGRNLGSIHSRGEFLGYLDSDDLLHPEKFTREVPVLRENAGLDFVWSDTAQFRGQAPGDGVCFTSPDGTDLLPRYILYPVWHTCSALYRRSTCVRLGPWNESFSGPEDWEYGVRLLSTRPRRRHIPKVLSFYRMHQSGQTRDRYRTWSIIKPDFDAFCTAEEVLRARGRLGEPRVRTALSIRYLEIAWRAGELGREKASRTAFRRAERMAPAGSARWRVALFENLWTLLGLPPASLLFRKSHNARYKAWIAWRKHFYRPGR